MSHFDVSPYATRKSKQPVRQLNNFIDPHIWNAAVQAKEGELESRGSLTWAFFFSFFSTRDQDLDHLDYCCHRRLLFFSCSSGRWLSSLVSDISNKRTALKASVCTQNICFHLTPFNWPPAPCHWVNLRCTVTGWMIHCWLNSGKQKAVSHGLHRQKHLKLK